MKKSPLLFIIILFIASCQPDEDKNFTATRDTYLGIWHAELYKNGAFDVAFELEILAHPSESNKILIDDFNQFGKGIRAVATISNTSVDIPQQNVSGYITSGFGTLKNQGNLLDLKYNVDDQAGQPPEDYSATLTK